MFYQTTACILSLYTISFFLYKWKFDIEKYSLQKNIENIDIIYHSIYVPILCYYCTSGFLLIDNNNEYNRLNSYNLYGDTFLKLYITNNIIHSIIIILKSSDKKYIVSMGLHHLLSSYSYYYAIVTKNCLYYGLLDGLCEFTVIFLNNIYLFKLLKIDNDFITKLNSIVLWISWVFLRILLFPYWIYYYLNDYNYIYENMNIFYTIKFNLFVSLVLLILSIIWFISIHHGLIKTLKIKLS